MRVRTSAAFLKVSGAKKFHARHTTWKIASVEARAEARYPGGFEVVARAALVVLAPVLVAEEQPWIPPHTTNVHDAPCQRRRGGT